MNNGLSEELPGFDDPIEMLRACHEKILAFCDLLEKLLDSPDVESAARVFRYFSTSAPLHHRDEDEDLFPRITGQSLTLDELVRSLKEEHQEIDRLWHIISTDLESVPASGFSSEFATTARDFCRINRTHITLENMELLPMAASILDLDELNAMGKSMAARRGVSYSGV